MPDLFRYSNSFEPILLEGMTANIHGSRLPSGGLPVVCKAVNALPELIEDFGVSLTAATWSDIQTVSELEMGSMELAQLRIRVLDDIRVRLYNPSSVQQWRTRTGSFYLPRFPVGVDEDFAKEYLFKASEFFAFEDEDVPGFALYSAVAATVNRVLFSGWRFKLEKIMGRGKIDIWVNSWPSSSGR